MADFDKVFRIVVPPWIRVSVRVGFCEFIVSVGVGVKVDSK
jgi:hypothetical protein